MNHTVIGGPFTLGDGTALPLSKGIRAGDYVFLSGQLGFDEKGHMAEGIEAQTRQCLHNIETLLAQAGGGLTDIVKATVWLTDLANFPGYNRVYAAAVSKDAPPARSTVASGLVLPGALIEIEVVAYIPVG